MSKKLLYTYNNETDTYEPVNYSVWQRTGTWVLYIAVLGVIVALSYALYSGLSATDRETELREQNEQLALEINDLQRQTDDALAVLKDIADRDNNFYRVLMQADPLTDAQRYVGLRHQSNNSAANSRLTDADLLWKLQRNVDLLQSQLYSQSKSFDFLREEAIKRKGRLDYMPAIQPIAFEDMEHLSSGFGYRSDPIYGTSKMHEGMDFSAEIGAPIYATAKGTVSYAGWKNGYGNVVYIDHGYDYETRYGHMSEIIAREGQKVERGELIGRVGNTGKSTGPHLHYEVRYKGLPQNPINYYFYDMTPEQYDELIRQAQNAGHVMD